MKTTFFFICIMITIALIILNGCGKNDPSPTEEATNKIVSKTWAVKTASVDGKDVTADFSGLTLKFTGTDYTTTNGHMVWPASGTWKFKSNSTKEILRSDDIDVTLNELTVSSLSLSFNWAKTTFGPGRISAVQGNYTFVFQ